MSLVPPLCENNASDAEYFSDESVLEAADHVEFNQNSDFFDIEDDNLLSDETAQYEINNTDYSVDEEENLSQTQQIRQMNSIR